LIIKHLRLFFDEPFFELLSLSERSKTADPDRFSIVRMAILKEVDHDCLFAMASLDTAPRSVNGASAGDLLLKDATEIPQLRKEAQELRFPPILAEADNDQRDPKEFLEWCEDWGREIRRLLKPSGSSS